MSTVEAVATLRMLRLKYGYRLGFVCLRRREDHGQKVDQR